MSEFERERAVAVSAVREAAQLCRAVQETTDPATLSKEDRSPVTVADFGSQALVCRHLAEAFPDDPVIGEERADALRERGAATIRAAVVDHVIALRPSASESSILDWIDRGGHRDAGPRVWTLDPIDGTKGFLRRDQYAVALALLVEGRPVVAALACPNLGPGGTIIHAVAGAGCLVEALDREARPARVSGVRDAREARFCESVESGHSSHGDAARVASALGIQRDSVRLDSQAKYAVVAQGNAEIYMRLPTRPGYVEKIWDHAAGALVVQEAGGRVTDIDGTPLDFSLGYQLSQNRGIVATNGLLHEEVLKAIRAL